MRSILATIMILLATLSLSCTSDDNSGSGDRPKATLRSAPRLTFPHDTDSNSPAYWANGQLYILNSAGHPWRSSGNSLSELGQPQAVTYSNRVNGGRWIEAVWRHGDGVLYGWYHLEPTGLVPGTTLTAPKIGALRSDDNGATWKDLGIVLEAPPNTLKPDAQNGYFAGGHGDFCVYLDQDERWLYFYFSNYAGDVREQGVSLARMSWKDRDNPVGHVFKYHAGRWTEPGLAGRVTPIWPAFIAWERPDCNAFWGPSIHWNSHLNRYVMLLNRSKAKGWVQDGIYISFAKTLDNPRAWSTPRRLLAGGSWYPQVIGLTPGGTDKYAGEVARFFMAGVSEYEIAFEK